MTPFTRSALRDFVSLRDAFDRLFEESIVPKVNDTGTSFAVDIKEKPNVYEVRAELPGVRPEDVQIDATANTVSISGEFAQEREDNEGRFLRREIRYGRFHRVFSLPLDIDTSTVEASFRDGVLTVTLPKGQAMRSRKIRVEDRSGQRAMAGHEGNGKDTNVRSEEPAGAGTGRG